MIISTDAKKASDKHLFIIENLKKISQQTMNRRNYFKNAMYDKAIANITMVKRWKEKLRREFHF